MVAFQYFFWLSFYVLMLAKKKIKIKKLKLKKKERRRKENVLTCEHQVQEYYISEQHVASTRLVINKTLYF